MRYTSIALVLCLVLPGLLIVALPIAEAGAPSINIVSPSLATLGEVTNSGQKVLILDTGKTYPVQWTTSLVNPRARYTVDLYRNYVDAPVLHIADGTGSTGTSVSWTLPELGADVPTGWGAVFFIRVSYPDLGLATDSDQFGVDYPMAIIHSPTPYTAVQVGQPVTVTWTWHGEINDLGFRVYNASGLSLMVPIPNTGSYVWTPTVAQMNPPGVAGPAFLSVGPSGGDPGIPSSGYVYVFLSGQNTGDTTAPAITGFVDGQRIASTSTTPTVGATFSDDVGVLTPSVKVLVDGVDVTAKATVTADGFTYPTSLLSRGTHTISVTVADLTGNTASESWTVFVTGNARKR